MSHIAVSNYNEWAADQARDNAESKYPLMWYQKGGVQNIVLVCVGVAFTSYQLYVGWGNMHHWIVALAMISFIGGWIADSWTTVNAFRLLPEFRKRRLQYPLFEWNPFLPDYPSLRDQIISFSSLVKLTALLLTPLIPALGIGGALSGMFAALNNKRNASYTGYELDQYDMLTLNAVKREEIPKGISYSGRFDTNSW